MKVTRNDKSMTLECAIEEVIDEIGVEIFVERLENIMSIGTAIEICRKLGFLTNEDVERILGEGYEIVEKEPKRNDQ
jgi:hypothetical protein